MDLTHTWLRRSTAFLLLALLVPASTLAQDTSVTVANVAPVVTSVTLPTDAVLPTAGGTTNVTTTVVVTDLNGCNDVARVAVEIRRPDNATHRPSADAAYISCAAGTAATYRLTFTMAYFDAAALDTSTYKAAVTVTDRQGATGTNLASLGTFRYAELAALRLDLSAVDFGAVDPGSASSILPLSVANQGNVRIDTQVSGTTLAHATEAANIGVGNVRYGLAANLTDAAALGSSAAAVSGFDLAAGASSARSLYWQLSVPDGATQWVPSGAYAGTLTVTSVKG